MTHLRRLVGAQRAAGMAVALTLLSCGAQSDVGPEVAPPALGEVALARPSAGAAVGQPAFGVAAYVLPEDEAGATPEQNKQRRTDAIQQYRKLLPQLQTLNVGSGIIWRPEDSANDAFWEVAHYAARDLGQPFAISLLLPDGDKALDLSVDNIRRPGVKPGGDYAKTGRFPNVTNYAAWISFAEQFIQDWRSKVLGQSPAELALPLEQLPESKRGPMPSLAVDLEMRVHQLEAVAATFPTLDIMNGKNLLKQVGEVLDNTAKRKVQCALRRYAADEAEYTYAVRDLKAFVQRAQRQGVKVGMTTLLPILDDYDNHLSELRRAFQVPLDDEPLGPDNIPWDGVSFQVQRSLFGARNGIGGLSIPPSFVYDYGVKTRRYFGDNTAIGLGLTSPGIGFVEDVSVATQNEANTYAQADASVAKKNEAHTYAQPANMAIDISRAMQAGYSRNQIGVFSLNGMLDKNNQPDARWFNASDTSHENSPAADAQLVGKFFAEMFHNLEQGLFDSSIQTWSTCDQ